MKINNVKTNVTELFTNDGAVIMFSYNTPVCAQLSGGGFVKTDEYYSRTTSKHINQWLDGVDAELVSQDFIDNLVG